MKELKIFRPNSKGTGSCLKFTQATDGDIAFQIFPQKPSKCELPDFDWSRPVEFLADWRVFAEMLMVFRGECESLGDGMGWLRTHCAGWSRLMLRHVIEPVHCYMLEIHEKCNDVENHGVFHLSVAEALGLSLVFEGILNHALVGGEP